MQYVDTSVLVAYLTPETYSATAIQVMLDINRQPLAISAWTETEFFSALGIKLRTKQLNEEQAKRVAQQYQSYKFSFLSLIKIISPQPNWLNIGKPVSVPVTPCTWQLPAIKMLCC